MTAGTRAWLSAMVVDWLRQVYRKWADEMAFAKLHGFRGPAEPSVSISLIQNYLDQASTPREWDLLTSRQQTALLRGVMAALVRQGLVRSSMGAGMRKGKTAMCYDPVGY